MKEFKLFLKLLNTVKFIFLKLFIFITCFGLGIKIGDGSPLSVLHVIISCFGFSVLVMVLGILANYDKVKIYIKYFKEES